ncbi:MAG: hypothetical protein AAFR21_12995 [Pseudomonadota bacterium]
MNKINWRVIAVGGPYLLLAACGDQGSIDQPTAEGDPVVLEQPPSDTPQTAPNAAATATDAYTLPAPANAIGMWSHPTLSFNSLILSLSRKGLTALNIEDGTDVPTLINVAGTDLAIGYDGRGAGAQGYAVVFDALANSGQLVSIDNMTRTLSTVGSFELEAEGVCIIDQETDRLVAFGDGAARYYSLSAGGLDNAALFSVRLPEDVIACTSRPDTGSTFYLTASGSILKQAGEEAPDLLAETGIVSPTGISISLRASEASGDERTLSATLGVMDKSSGTLSLFDTADGHALGTLSIQGTFDFGPVTRADSFAIGFDNYGAVYRDGVLTVCCGAGDDPTLTIVPWNGILTALTQPLGSTVSARDVIPEAETGFEIEIDLPSP